MQQDLELDGVVALAGIQSLKHYLCRMPIGGAKGNIKIDPSNYSWPEINRIFRRYTIELWKRSMINPATDVMSVDVNTDSRHMNLIRDSFKNISLNPVHEIDACVTGKDLNTGGVEQSERSVAYGISTILDFILENANEKIFKGTGLTLGGSKKSIILEGWRRRNGYLTSQVLNKDNFKIVGIVHDEYGCFNRLGFDGETINSYVSNNNGSFKGISKVLNASNEIITKDCDIFVTFAEPFSINKERAEAMNCKILVEGCNMVCTPEALEVFARKNVVVVPDLIGNVGSSIYGYIEWLKNIEHKNLTLLMRRLDINNRNNLIRMLSTTEYGTVTQEYEGPTEGILILRTMEDIIENAIRETLQNCEVKKLDFRHSAYNLAIERMHEQFEGVSESLL